MAFMDIQNVSNHSPFIYEPAQEIMRSKYDFNAPLCRIRDGGGPPPPQAFNKFQRTKLTPINYISLEKKFNGEWDLF